MAKELRTRKGIRVLIDNKDFNLVKDMVWRVSARGYVETTLYWAPYKLNVKLHRLIMSPPDHLVIDHINSNKLDNRRINLRICTQAENNRNASFRKDKSTSKYKGVHCERGRWKAQIQLNKKKYTLGTFDTELEAAKAYNCKAVELHGKFALLNKLAISETV